MKRNKIKNELIMVMIFYGIMKNSLELGMTGLWQSITGIVMPILMLFILFSLRMLGAGDIKLLCGIGAILGGNKIIWIIIASFIVGAIMALYKMLRNKNLYNRILYFAAYFYNSVCYGTMQPYYNVEKEGMKNAIYFSIAITIATILCIIEK